jgi:hypothetical protein
MQFRVIALALAAASLTVTADDGRLNPVAGEKLDSGLGELPHYRDWKKPSRPNVTAVAGRTAPKPLAEARSAADRHAPSGAPGRSRPRAT